MHMSRDLSRIHNGINARDPRLRTTWHAPESSGITSKGKSGGENRQRRLHRGSGATASARCEHGYADSVLGFRHPVAVDDNLSIDTRSLMVKYVA